MSNTRKITANKKNRKEKGTRADILGSNPHSNGDIFSRSWSDRADKISAVVRTTIGKAVVKEKAAIEKIIH